VKDTYIAHFYQDENGTIHIQPVFDHNSHAAALAEMNSPLPELSSIAWLCGILHDAGKYREGFQNYIKRAMNEPVRRGEEDHSTGGGFLVEQILPKLNLAQMIQMAVFCHHGLKDSFSIERNSCYIEERLKKIENTEKVEERYYQFFDKELLKRKCNESRQMLSGIMNEIRNFILQKNTKKNLYGNRDFFIGLYERTIMSLLIDADRTDTACFMQNRECPIPKDDKELQAIWDRSIIYLEKYLNKLQSTSRLDDYRRDISGKCMEAGKKPAWLYRLTVPTGAGKTLSSLRFALHHAKEYHKKHIIYVAPYQSILDQNAQEIRKAVGDSDIVLEHHFNVLHEDDKMQEHYELLTENWDSPIIVTTAVQFLNTLFVSGSSNIRRMYNILNSVIIFDEIQALPVRITKMFNLAVNFLSTFGKSTVVLCSATQPLYDELDENRLLPPVNMIEETEGFAKVFKRTEIIDVTEEGRQGFSIEELQEFIWDKTKMTQQILVIVNTKKCAEKVYNRLKEQCKESGYLLFHLSTNMCAENRRETLARIEESLKDKKLVICISTQVVEAGVNLSFQCVIRSLAGLDNIIQAAGRCNRHGEWEIGYVYIVQMLKEAENVDKLTDIRKAQESMRLVLLQMRMHPQDFGNSLASEQAIRLYYQIYLKERKAEMEYPASVNGLSVNLLDLLSANEKMWGGLPQEIKVNKRNLLFKQAFKTAGDLFEVIPEDGKIDVVVEYNEEAKNQIDVLRDFNKSVGERRRAMRRLQPYTVGISEQLRQKLGNALSSIHDEPFQVLSENYYSKEIGVSEEPLGMELLNF